MSRLPWAFGALVLVGALIPAFGSEFVIRDVGAAALSISLIAMSISFLAGFGGMLSLAQSGIAGISGYTVAILAVNNGWGWHVASLAGIVMGSFFGLLIGMISVRTYGVYFIMVTLAFGLMIYNFASSNFALTNGTSGLYGLPPLPSVGGINFADAVPFYYVCLGTVVLSGVALSWLLKTQAGLAYRASADNPERLESLGHRVYWHRVTAFGAAAVVASAGGVLQLWYSGGIAPANLDLLRAVDVLVIAVLGGVATLSGPVLGAWLFTYMSIYVSTYTDRYNTVIGVVFILVIYFLPGGVSSIAASGRARIFRRSRKRTNEHNLEGART